MRGLASVASALLLATATAQDWVRYRGPGELLPPQLGGVAGPPADLTVWEFAWEFHRDALAPPLLAGAPLPAAVLDSAVASSRESSKDDDNDLALLSLWGLARMARHHEGAARALHEVVFGALARPAPVGEVAAVALGLGACGDDAAITALRDLANDTAAGRKLVGQWAVPERTRCFALHGLGLAAETGRGAELQFRVLAAVERLLLPDAATPTEVRIAALHVLLLLQVAAAPKLPGAALVLLDHQWSLDEGQQFLSVRAQVPLAAASLLRPEDPAAVAWRERLVAALHAEGTSQAVRRSCAHALSRLCRPYETTESPDARSSEVLRAVAIGSRDQQTQNLAYFALGTIGGASNEKWLLEQLAAGGAAFLRYPWIALGLGAGAALRGQAANAQVIAALERKVTNPNPLVFGAIATGLGLGRSQASSPLLATVLRRQAGMGDAAAPVCSALGLLGDADAVPLLLEMAGTDRAPRLCAEAMQAMASSGPAGETALRKLLLDATVSSARRHAAAVALRGRADPETAAALARSLADPKAGLAERRLAAFALGSLCDRSERHWSAKLASSIGYRGATAVLVAAPNGVLRLP